MTLSEVLPKILGSKINCTTREWCFISILSKKKSKKTHCGTKYTYLIRKRKKYALFDKLLSAPSEKVKHFNSM